MWQISAEYSLYFTCWENGNKTVKAVSQERWINPCLVRVVARTNHISGHSIYKQTQTLFNISYIVAVPAAKTKDSNRL